MINQLMRPPPQRLEQAGLNNSPQAREPTLSSTCSVAVS